MNQHCSRLVCQATLPIGRLTVSTRHFLLGPVAHGLECSRLLVLNNEGPGPVIFRLAVALLPSDKSVSHKAASSCNATLADAITSNESAKSAEIGAISSISEQGHFTHCSTRPTHKGVTANRDLKETTAWVELKPDLWQGEVTPRGKMEIKVCINLYI
ncbi:unnamed protein product [Protopolystoma xenopodis]|uniref:Uncharacterized protein n=1 Tax=Protopolystoma xenopodis TaxID=117903 RepID=A0A448WW91_9PLAT|nr:unnamed protein product [Protopolystoma xenopodis]